MTSLDDCEKWLLEHGWDYDVNNMANILHEFSKTTVGHSWVDQGFRAEEEKKKSE